MEPLVVYFFVVDYIKDLCDPISYFFSANRTDSEQVILRAVLWMSRIHKDTLTILSDHVSTFWLPPRFEGFESGADPVTVCL